MDSWRSLGGTLAEHWWNLLRNLSAAQDGSSPEDYRNTTRFGEPWWNLGGMLVDPWRNLPRNLLAARDGFALPENHKESESNSAPKPLLWLRPQTIAVGEKQTRIQYVQATVPKKITSTKSVISCAELFVPWLE